MTGRTAKGPKRRPNREREEVQTHSGMERDAESVERATGADPTKGAPTEAGTAIAKPPIKNQCTARVRRTGERCRRHAILGANVCPKHGGDAPQVRRAAGVRLAKSVDWLMAELLKIAKSSADENTRLRAINSALDRAGLGANATLEVGLTLRPFEALLDRIDRSGAPTPTVPAVLVHRATVDDDDDGGIVDVEVVDDRASSPTPAPTAVVRTANGKRIPAAKVERLMTWDEAFGEDAPVYRDPQSARVSRGV